MGVYTLLLICALMAHGVSGHRVLMVSMQFPSRILEQLIIGQELVSRGHEVYTLLADKPQNKDHRARSKGVKVITFKYPDDLIFVSSEEYDKWLGGRIFSDADPIETTMMELRREAGECKAMMADTDMLNKVKAMNFDLVIGDGVYICPCYLVLPEHLGIPFVSMYSDLAPWWSGVPALPSFKPAYTLPTTDRLTFIERMASLADLIFLHNYFIFDLVYGLPDNGLLERYVPHVNGWGDLYSRGLLHLITADHHLEWPAPSMPHVKFLPGITPSPAKPLTGTMKQLVEKASDGIIVVSFGSTSAFLPHNIIMAFLEAFRELRQTVIWKMPWLPASASSAVPSNVQISSWLPQNDLLGHNNTRLFITHCGNNGQYEALYHGVPMLGFPLHLDQEHNSFRLEAKGFGLVMDIKKFQPEDLKYTILELLQNDTYSARVSKYSAMLKSRPMLPREEAAYWIEHVLEFGAEHLRSHGIELPWYQFFMLDILGFILALCLSFLVFSTVFLYILCRYFCYNSSKHKKD